MKHLWIFALSLIGLFIICTSQAHAVDTLESWEEWENIFLKTDGWKVGKNAKGIKTYTRPVEISPVDSFRGVTELETDMETLIGLFMDLDGKY